MNTKVWNMARSLRRHSRVISRRQLDRYVVPIDRDIKTPSAATTGSAQCHCLWNENQCPPGEPGPPGINVINIIFCNIHLLYYSKNNWFRRTRQKWTPGRKRPTGIAWFSGNNTTRIDASLLLHLSCLPRRKKGKTGQAWRTRATGKRIRITLSTKAGV